MNTLFLNFSLKKETKKEEEKKVENAKEKYVFFFVTKHALYMLSFPKYINA